MRSASERASLRERARVAVAPLAEAQLGEVELHGDEHPHVADHFGELARLGEGAIRFVVPGQMHVEQPEVDERGHRLIGQPTRARVPERGLEVESRRDVVAAHARDHADVGGGHRREPDLARYLRAVVRAAVEPVRLVEVAQLPFHDREDVLGVPDPGLVGGRLGDRERGDGAIPSRVERRFLDVGAGDPANELRRLGCAHRLAVAQRALVERARILLASLALERLSERGDAIEPRRVIHGGTFIRGWRGGGWGYAHDSRHGRAGRIGGLPPWTNESGARVKNSARAAPPPLSLRPVRGSRSLTRRGDRR